MKINQVLVESAGATVAFAFGRFNPAHQGHIEVWRAVEEAGANWFIGTNPSTLGPNDPLTFQQKSAWMEEIYPPITGHVVPEQSVLTLAAYIFKKVRKNERATVAYITDATDWAWSGKLLNQYNGVEGAHGYYKFAQIVHVPSPRVSSATALRDAARADDKVAFYHASGTDPKSKVAGLTYFDTVKQAVEKYPLPIKKVKKVKEQGVAEDSLGLKKLHDALWTVISEQTIDEETINEIDPGMIANLYSVFPTVAKIIVSNALNKARKEAKETSLMIDVMKKHANNQPVTPEESEAMKTQFKDIVSYGLSAVAGVLTGAVAGPAAGAGVALAGAYKKELLALLQTKGPEVLIGLLKSKGKLDVVDILSAKLLGKHALPFYAAPKMAESQLNELAGYGSDKGYTKLDSYKRYDVYVSKQKFNNLFYIAVAENPRTLTAKFKAKGKNPQEAIQNLYTEVDKEIDVATKVSGRAIIDFNVDFVRDILELSTDTFYAKIIPGPMLVLAGPEMMEYPEIMSSEGYKPSAIRTYKGGEGTTKLPAVPLSTSAAVTANLIANGRYVLGNEEIDKDGNRVFNLEFDSVVQDKNEKMRLRAPALTIGTARVSEVVESEQKTVAKTWDQMTPKEKSSGVKGRTVWNEKTQRYYTVFDVPVKQTTDEASLSTMRDYFAGDDDARDPYEITKQRLHFSKDKNARPTVDKRFRSQEEYQQWLKQNKLRQLSDVQEDEEAGEVEKTGQLIPFPAGTTKVSVSDVYDWYKLGQVISDLDDANPADFGQGAPETVIAFGSEEEENKLLPLLQRLGLKLKDIDQPVGEAYHAGSLYEILKKERTKNWSLTNKRTQ